MDTLQEGDCAVCIQKFNHPAKLPCDHIFCFLCIKGVFLRSHTCPMCRTPIPEEYLDNPQLLNEITDEETECVDDKYWWYYEGKDGWWGYDERSNEDLESDFNEGKGECKLLVAGAIYCVDFTKMIQYRQSDPRRKRKVKRDIHTHPSKGIAGIRKMCHKQKDNVHSTNSTDIDLNETTETIQNVHDVDNISQILRSMSIQESESPSNSPNTEDT